MTLRTILGDKNKAIMDLQQKINQLQLDINTKFIEVFTGTDDIKKVAIEQIGQFQQQIIQVNIECDKLQIEKEEKIVEFYEKIEISLANDNLRFNHIEANYINWKTTLFDAIKSDDLHQLQTILAIGVDISQTDEAGDTVLHISAKKPLTEINQQIIDIILDRYSSSFYAVNKAGKSAIEEAAMEAEWSKLDWLDDKGKSIKNYSRDETLNKLYAVASLENKKKLANKQLHEGAKQNNLASIKKALDEGADINDVTYGATALYNAVAYQYSECVAYLLEKGADESIPCGNEMPYDVTVTKKDRGTMTLLANTMLINNVLKNSKEGVANALAKNADISQAMYANQQTALHIAAAARSVEIVQLLLASKANIIQQDGDGQIALHRAAAIEKNEEVVQCLIQQHVIDKPEIALYKIEDNQKKTPLDSANESGDLNLKHRMSEWFGLFSAASDSKLFSSRQDIFSASQRLK